MTFRIISAFHFEVLFRWKELKGRAEGVEGLCKVRASRGDAPMISDGAQKRPRILIFYKKSWCHFNYISGTNLYPSMEIR